MNSVCKRKDVAQASLALLRQQTKDEIAVRLDSRKILLAESKLHRDWRGLAEYANLDPSTIRSSKISCTQHCLYLWIQKGGSINDLWKALECIDRYDIIEDTLQYIYDDYDYALSRDVLQLKPIASPSDEIIPSITDFDANILTTDDQQNLQDGGSLQFYDALVLYTDEDIDFVDEMVQKLEGEYNLKLCLKDRDLVGGLSFEYSAVMRLIVERCARVIVVLSPAFLESKANSFLTQFAHAHSIDQRRRIVIPCMVKPCKKPHEISYSHSLDYFRTVTPDGFLWDYWKKLADSITYAPKTNLGSAENSSYNRMTIREIQPLSEPSVPALPAPNHSQHLKNHRYSNGMFSRFIRKSEELGDKNTNTTLKVNESKSFIDIKEASSKRQQEKGLYGRNTDASQYSQKSSTSTVPLIKASNNKGIRSVVRKALRLKEKKKKIKIPS